MTIRMMTWMKASIKTQTETIKNDIQNAATCFITVVRVVIIVVILVILD
jgi:hypothetical protein